MPDGYWHGTGTVQVTKELTKLDDCISNIDESLFTNMEAEEEILANPLRKEMTPVVRRQRSLGL